MEAKTIIVAGTFVGIVLIVVTLFTSFQSGWDNNPGGMGMKTESTINLENGSPALGSESAPITIVEFGDYQCESCYYWFHNTRSTIIDNYIETGKAKLIFVDLPFLGRDSKTAAQASYCAEDQGKYWEYHTMLYTFQDGAPDSGWASQDRLNSFAFTLEMNMDEFNDCMDSSKYKIRVQANYHEAVKQGAQSTPTFIIISSDGTTKKFAGAQPYSVFAATIESML
uniref:Putative DSBA-like thioredoxin domain protein n=1 Tax=uncultured marine crenarchaeote HF4000_ANIW93E5 TaxID=455563 RepID=B3T2P0_9ARCH|nr:putative DSBA-like thioredoxin domain protein [uncultured marine crenarchaeote HF4000_ANIW93E5]